MKNARRTNLEVKNELNEEELEPDERNEKRVSRALDTRGSGNEEEKEKERTEEFEREKRVNEENEGDETRRTEGKR